MANKQQTFIKTYGPLAEDISNATGLVPELVLGQIAHETDWGQHVLGNNVFGISPGGKVKPYPSVSDAAQAYVKLINGPRYQSVGALPDLTSQAQELSNSHYGPDLSYGGKIARASRAVIEAGYKPSQPPGPSGSDQPPLSSDDEKDVAEGQAVFEQMTGIKPLPRPDEPKNTGAIDVSSDPDVDQGKAIFQQITGIDPDSLNDVTVKGSSDNALGQHFSQANDPNIGQQFVAGAQRGVADVGDTVANVFTKASQYGDQNPLLASIDKATGLYRTPEEAAQKEADRQQIEAAYDQRYGQSIPALAGRIVGNTAITAPMLGPLGRAGMALGEGAASTVANPLIRGAIKGAATIGTGAAQGAAGAALTGGDPTTGAMVGAAVPVIGNALQKVTRGASNTLQAGGAASNLINSQLADKLVKLVGKGIGYHFGDFGGYLVGEGIAPVINEVTKKYGPKVAKQVADMIQKANEEAIKNGIPGALGSTVPKKKPSPQNPLKQQDTPPQLPVPPMFQPPPFQGQ